MPWAIAPLGGVDTVRIRSAMASGASSTSGGVGDDRLLPLDSRVVNSSCDLSSLACREASLLRAASFSLSMSVSETSDALSRRSAASARAGSRPVFWRNFEGVGTFWRATFILEVDDFEV